MSVDAGMEEIHAICNHYNKSYQPFRLFCGFSTVFSKIPKRCLGLFTKQVTYLIAILGVMVRVELILLALFFDLPGKYTDNNYA